MSTIVEAKLIGIDELKAAIKRNPALVKSESQKFIQRGLAAYKRGVMNSPWRVGMSGGGSPVALMHGGNLRDTHQTEISVFKGLIKPTAAYAGYVHEGTYKMKARPWLEFVRKDKDQEIEKLYQTLLENITKDLAK